MLKSRVQQPNFRQTALSRAEAQHRVLLAMAADAEKLRAQAERIRELRDAKGRREGTKISQETAAHEIGVSVRQYRTWESTGADMMPENVKAAAAYYGTTVDYIECGTIRPVRQSTPDLANGSELTAARLSRIEKQLKANAKALADLSAQIEAVRVEAASGVVEVIARIEAMQPPEAGAQ